MKKRDSDPDAMLAKFLSPADAQSLVKPPPDHPPHSGPAESTPLTGNLTAPPSMTRPSRSGLAGYFDGDSAYVKVSSGGQVGYLPRTNLQKALQIDPQLQVLSDD